MLLTDRLAHVWEAWLVTSRCSFQQRALLNADSNHILARVLVTDNVMPARQ